MMVSGKRKRELGQLWFPDGFKARGSGREEGGEPVGEDSVGFRRQSKDLLDLSLMEVEQTGLGKDVPSDTSRFRFEEVMLDEVVMLEEEVRLDQRDQTDDRRWTQSHFEGTDRRISSTEPTSAQQGAGNQSMDVNVCGPDGFTPLMIASCSGGGLETGNSEEEGDASANVISSFICQGANVLNQAGSTGETALHLAARYAHSDAAKRLLEAGADPNVTDNVGRTPLHSAVAADAQGVFQILIRNRATDLDAHMHDGTTPLILASRLAVEGMVEDLIHHHADVNAADDLGKSALHWAAAVNNVDAVLVLLKNGANKDLQNNKEETPLFLAAREGSYEAAQVLLEHFANREIGDHLDLLPRNIAQERMHHHIVKLLDDYNLVRNLSMHNCPIGAVPFLSPLLSSPKGCLRSMKPAVHSKKARRPGAKGVVSKGRKTVKAWRRKGRGCLLDMSAVLQTESPESPRTYMCEVASPATSTRHPQVTANPREGISHPGVSIKHNLGCVPLDPPLTRHAQLPGSVFRHSTSVDMSGQRDRLCRMHVGMRLRGELNSTMRVVWPGGLCQSPVTSPYASRPASNLSQTIGYQGPPDAHLSPMLHLTRALQMSPQQQLRQNRNPNASNSGSLGSDPSNSDLQPESIQTILSQETRISSTVQFLGQPAQRRISASVNNAPNQPLKVPDHPFLHLHLTF